MRNGRQRARRGRGEAPGSNAKHLVTGRVFQVFELSGRRSRKSAVAARPRCQTPRSAARPRCQTPRSKHLVQRALRAALQPWCPGRARGRAGDGSDLRRTRGRGHTVRERARRPPRRGPDLGLHEPVERRQDQQRRHPLPDEVRDLHLSCHRERRRDGDRSQSQSHQQRGWNPPDLLLHHPIRFHARLPESLGLPGCARRPRAASH